MTSSGPYEVLKCRGTCKVMLLSKIFMRLDQATETKFRFLFKTPLTKASKNLFTPSQPYFSLISHPLNSLCTAQERSLAAPLQGHQRQRGVAWGYMNLHIACTLCLSPSQAEKPTGASSKA